jgi:hypothetical protein
VLVILLKSKVRERKIIGVEMDKDDGNLYEISRRDEKF